MPNEEPSTYVPRIPRPTTDGELATWLRETIGVVLPSTSVCPGHSNPFAAVADAFFARCPVVVWKASRGFGGKTMAMGALAFAEAVTLRASVTLLGGSGEQAARVLEYLNDFWKEPNAPTNVLATDPAGKKSSLIWGNKVTALMASMASVSGPHPQRLRIDEVDLVDITLMDQALGQPMSKNGVDAQVVLSSAHYEADGTLTEVLKRAKDKGWKVHEWCWRECVAPHGWIMPADIERTRTIVTKAMFDVQYDLQEPSPEGRAIDPEAVEWMFRGPLIESNVGGGEFHYQEFEPPVSGAEYATGGDWARTRDFVEIITNRIDASPIRLVAYQRFRKKATQYTLAAFSRQTERYPGNASHDSTSLGGQMMEDLIEVGPGTQLDGFTMTGGPRRKLFTDYIVAIEQRRIVSPRIDVLYRQHKFVKNADLWGAGHPPDGFVAGALANRAASQAPLGLAGEPSGRPVQDVRPQSQDGLRSMLTALGPAATDATCAWCDRAVENSQTSYCCTGCRQAHYDRQEVTADKHTAACRGRALVAVGLIRGGNGSGNGNGAHA